MMRVSGTQSVDILISESEQIEIARSVIRRTFNIRKNDEIDVEKMVIFRSWQVRSFMPVNIEVIRDATDDDVIAFKMLSMLKNN